LDGLVTVHVAIRVDGGPDIGYGHLVRSNAVAEEIQSRNGQVSVATATPDVANDIIPAPDDILSLDSRSDPEVFCTWLDSEPVDVVFTDAYPVDTDYQRAIRDRVPLVIYQDDVRHIVCADALVNGNLYGASLEYEFTGPTPQRFQGPDYTPLRAEMRNLAAREPPWRERAERAIVTMGGSDVANLTPTVLTAFDGFDGRVDAIVGPGFSGEQETAIRTAAETVQATVHVARDPDDLPQRMFDADLAVATASTTTYELLALGTPIVSCPVVDNQRRLASSLDERDAATVLGQEAGEEEFRRAITTLVDDPALRRRHRNRGRQLVDGRGVERIVDVLEDVVSK
jgi:spore coat polysaccharide biosynthesis predicted glycosyltransferase SpsG